MQMCKTTADWMLSKPIPMMIGY